MVLVRDIPFFLEQPPLYYEKILTPHFGKNFKKPNSPFFKKKLL